MSEDNSEREAFEKWERRSRGRLWSSLLTNEDGEYVSCRVFTEWLAWKARSATTVGPPESEREAFEQYAIKAWGGWMAATMRDDKGGRYREGYVDDSWVAWQARAAIARNGLHAMARGDAADSIRERGK